MIRRFRATIDFYFSDSTYPDLAELCARLEEKFRTDAAEWVEAISPGYPDVEVIEDGPYAS